MNADQADEVAQNAILGYLAQSEVHALLAEHGAAEAEERTVVRGEIAAIRTQIDELADAVGSGEVSSTLAGRSEQTLMRRLRAAEARERELGMPALLRQLAGTGADVAERWKTAPMSARRELATAILSPEMLGTFIVHRSARRGANQPHVAERITFSRA